MVIWKMRKKEMFKSNTHIRPLGMQHDCKLHKLSFKCVVFLVQGQKVELPNCDFSPFYKQRCVTWWSKEEWLLHFSGYYFHTEFACLIWSVKQKSILPCLLGMVQLYKKNKLSTVGNFPFLIWNILDQITTEFVPAVWYQIQFVKKSSWFTHLP